MAVAAFLTLLKIVTADSQEFGIVSIHSASAVHYLSLHDKDGLYLTSGPDSLSASVTDAGKLKFSNNKFVVIDKDGKWIEGSENDASTGFAISSGRVTYQDKENFYAVPTTNPANYVISGQDDNGAIGVALTAFLTSGSRANDFEPSAEKVSKVGSTTIDATSSGTSPDIIVPPTSTPAVTVAAISQITDGQIQATHSIQIQSENGVAKIGFPGGVGSLGMAIALLI
ncbi:hypothetical protein C6P44_000807 [Monosporozyma unispora]|nr:hypothetical protein C6P44_000807 [Kazachstania unispora]